MNNLYTTIVSNLKKHADNEGARIAKRYHKVRGNRQRVLDYVKQIRKAGVPAGLSPLV